MVKKFFIINGKYTPYVSSYDEDSEQYKSDIKDIINRSSSFFEVSERPNRYCVWNGQSWVLDVLVKKNEAIEEISAMSFVMRNKIVPDYKLVNAALGIYSDSEKQSFFNVVSAFRNEFYRLKEMIESSSTIEEIDDIVKNHVNFPSSAT
jgi:hypothetical protein